MKVLFLFPYPLGESPSQRFRFEQYFPLMEKAGIEFVSQSFWDLETWRILYQPGKTLKKAFGFLKGLVRRIQMLLTLATFDYVFIHRECAPVGPPLFEWLISMIFRKKVIYDFDDAIWLPNTSEENRLVSILKWPTKINFICRWSYKISCGNLYLCDYAYRYNRNIVLNPTTVDTETLHNPRLYKKKSSNDLVIGWTGSHSTLKYLDKMEGILQEVEQKYDNVSFTVIANQAPDLELKRMNFVKWSQENEISALAEFDIGIMPLTDDPWARGKCGFKALQYMAMEIPTIASPVGVNTTIIDDGVNGRLAASGKEWSKSLAELIENPELRLKLGKQGRETVIRNYSVRANADNFFSLFT
jgi:glycosyltransferase involved in cell wall biosynthesis